jgi:hypothetical protein
MNASVRVFLIACFSMHSTKVPPPDQNDKYLSIASYITSGKLLFVTGTQPVQQFPATPISTTIITATFHQIIPFYSQLGLNLPPILLKVHAIREEIFAGKLWISAWGRDQASICAYPSHGSYPQDGKFYGSQQDKSRATSRNARTSAADCSDCVPC